MPTLAAVAVMGGTMLGVHDLYAQEGNGSRTSLVTRIAEKFNLNEDEVKAVFDAEREERAQERETSYNEMLTSAVANGEITEEQKALIVEKRAELDADHEKNREQRGSQDGTEHTEEEREERRAEREEEREALEQWAESNGIDMKYLRGKGMGGPRR